MRMAASDAVVVVVNAALISVSLWINVFDVALPRSIPGLGSIKAHHDL